jgi:phospholipid transport system substrate-binding protein
MPLRGWPRWSVPLAGFLLLLALAARPVAASAGAPTDAMRDFFAAVNVTLSDPTTEEQPMERLRAIRRHVDDVFDFREASMLALGREWAARTPVEQNEFVALFADLLERSFVWRVAGKATTAGGVKVDYLGETVDRDTATVETAIAARDGNPLRLGFRMVYRGERWVVRDVVMDGVSTMENYHAQFLRLARDGSWPELMAQLRAKVGTPAGTVQVASAPPMTWPSELRGPNRVAQPMASALAAPVPTAIARPLETAVIARSSYAVPPPTPPPAVSELAPAPSLAPEVLTAPPASVALAPPPPAPPRVEPPPVARGMVPRAATPPAWWVQVGAYRNATTAGRVAKQVQGEILVIATPNNTEPLLRVRVGPFFDRAHAQARLEQLEAQGWKPFIISQ